MAQLTFPVTLAGLAAPVWIGLDGQATAALRVRRDCQSPRRFKHAG